MADNSGQIPSILIVDDEEAVLYTLETVLKREGYQIERAGSAREALDKLDARNFDLIISDLNMPGESGLELLDAVRKKDSESLLILITAFGSEAVAVDAMKRGAYDYLAKPFANDDLKITVRRALEKAALRHENMILRLQLHEREGLQAIIGSSEGMQRIYDLIERVAPNDVTVLITGESGTGKELVAQAIHSLSARKSVSFVRVNCAAIPETLIESELFGSEKGAFSGAISRRLGKFELADRGTIFLDEIGDMSLATQTKILRILQEKEFERLGGQHMVKVDTRVITATNRDLTKAIAEGAFREDLFYRLNVVNIQLPPLRDRLSDIPALVEHFSRKFTKKLKKENHPFSDAFLAKMMKYPWPGNVRELQNLVERIIILEDEGVFPPDGRNGQKPTRPEVESREYDRFFGLPYKEAKGNVIRGFELKYFESLLKKAKGNISKASRIAGMHRKNLYLKLKDLELVNRDEEDPSPDSNIENPEPS